MKRSLGVLLFVLGLAFSANGCLFLLDEEECCDEWGCYDCDDPNWNDGAYDPVEDASCIEDWECGPGCVCVDNVCVEDHGDDDNDPITDPSDDNDPITDPGDDSQDPDPSEETNPDDTDPGDDARTCREPFVATRNSPYDRSASPISSAGGLRHTRVSHPRYHSRVSLTPVSARPP